MIESQTSREGLVAHADLNCVHCKETMDPRDIIKDSSELTFCCHGCLNVYHLLKDNGLSDYYKYTEDDSSISQKSNTQIAIDKYQYMDTDSFRNTYIRKLDGHDQIEFQIEGIHCMACVWLIENTSSILDFVKSAKLNLGTEIVTFNLYKDSEYSLAKLSQTLNSLGYKLHPTTKSNGAIKKSDRTDLIRVGIAASAMSNIMIYAVSNYAGATQGYDRAFDWISFGFALPVVTYSAIPFYKSTIAAIKYKTSNVDIPLTLAIVFGFAISTYHLITGSGDVYFDSITTLIFLILLSRYFVKLLTRKALSTKGITSLFLNTGVTRIRSDKQEKVFSKDVKVNDSLILEEDERVVFDCVLESEQVLILNTIITGESTPIRKLKGDTIDAGSICLNNGTIVRVSAIGQDTKLGKNLEAIENDSIQKNPNALRAQKLSKFFTIAILSLSAFLLINGWITGNVPESINRILALLIVGCPCAFAIATPIVIATRINKLKKLGIYIKNENSFEALKNSENIIFDKTGTLTLGNFAVTDFKSFSNAYSNDDLLSITYFIEKTVQHPIAFALKQYCKKEISKSTKTIEVQEREILKGIGVRAQIDSTTYEISSTNETSQDKHIALHKVTGEDKLVLAVFTIKDALNKDTKLLVDKLRNSKKLHISTGDNQEMANKVAKELSIDKSQVHANSAPEDKLRLVSSLKNACFIGDGDNDALAMKKSNISIAIGGSADMALRSSDVYVVNNNLRLITTLFATATEVARTMNRNFIIAFSYNTVGITLALIGYITPLIAAILMPISSLTILASSLAPLTREEEWK